MSKISIITPVYIDNPDKIVWFGEALESLKNQTFTDWEVIIIDDASSIDIGEIKWKYQNDERFRWFKTSHQQGPAKVRNTAAALAESEALLPLDADDMLGTNETLELMYQAWEQDKTQVIYGNLQRLKLSNGAFAKESKPIVLADYNFEVLASGTGLEGIFPVTGLHSVDCHIATGGWKPELDAGLEDVEYWLNAGKRGFCGRKINHTTLIYRRHEQSRAYDLRHGNRRENEMRTRIVSIHKDLFEGRFPVGCCGKGKGNVVNNGNVNVAMAAKVTTLDDFRADEKIWIEYQGNKRGSVRIAGNQTSPVSEYIVLGPGHKFQIHRNDIKRFKGFAEIINNQRQSAYLVGIPSPVEPTEPEIEIVENTPAPQPQLAEILSLDEKAMVTRGIEPEPVADIEPIGQIEIVESEGPGPISELVTPVVQPETQTYDLSELGLAPSLQATLETENWTLERLAGAGAVELTPYRGIGAKRAGAIIEAAKRIVS